jgi:hypothetical protein
MEDFSELVDFSEMVDFSELVDFSGMDGFSGIVFSAVFGATRLRACCVPV